MRGMTYKSARRRAQRALLAIGAGLTLAVAAVPVAQATAATATDGTCTASATGVLASGGTATGSSATVCTGKPSGGDTGHKVG
jgi:hypothetical protein